MNRNFDALDQLLLNHLNYDAGFQAIRSLLAQFEKDKQELADEIVRIDAIARSTSGLNNELAIDEWQENVHYSCYQDAVHSMAAVGMIAPFLESILREEYRRVGREWPKEFLVVEIVRFARETGLANHMPADFEPTLSALFVYRNRMLHLGFEWPEEAREKFAITIGNSGWPTDWFSVATSGDKPWMFYMSKKFH